MKLNKSMLLGSLLICSLSSNASDHGWGYDVENGPSHWAEINNEYTLCSTGKNQSPIDIHGALKTHHDKLKLLFQKKQQDVINNGHTIQVNVNENDTLEIDNQIFKLQQFHFHAPSENTIDGKQFPLESHFVFKNDHDELTVLAVLFKEGKHNKELENVWKQLPQQIGQQVKLDDLVDISALLPSTLNYYRFSGSLTTPPCSEGVRWVVLSQLVEVSKEQIAKFHNVMKHDNNRAVQPLNGRIIIN